jgi:energy-coupling factor transport system permease protein
MIKRNFIRQLTWMLIFFLLISFGNPIFNHLGETVLFTYFRGRPYTLEALFYGFAMASMFLSIITWFSTYNEVMSSDKFLYCFGGLAPSVSMILTMVLRLVPSFIKKTQQIAGARKCVGMSVEDGTKSEKIEHGLTIVSALTSWALEGGVVMSDSMRSRGFGCGKRTSFSIYRMKKSDIHLLILMLILIFTIILCAVRGGMDAVYFPRTQIAVLDNIWTILGIICYFIFLSIPTALHLLEELTWHILKSKI